MMASPRKKSEQLASNGAPKRAREGAFVGTEARLAAILKFLTLSKGNLSAAPERLCVTC
ncbi:MAG: hypothetical protein Q9211_005429 [Gyalolechia sp. 1 TL-2023]